MTEEEINIAVAELCGWELIDCKRTGRNPARSFDHYDKHGNEPIPNYCGDLNAMREALLTLTPTDQDRYAAVLSQIVDGRRIDLGAARIETTTKVLFASAAQQAKAFLIIRGKWMDT